MELEEAINRLENLKLTYEQESILILEYEENFLLDKKAIETVLKELEYKDKQIEKLYNEKLELQDYKDEYEKGNFISKKKIEDKMEEIKSKKYFGLANAIKNSKIEILQELLEE